MTDRYWRVMDQDTQPLAVTRTWPYGHVSVRAVSDGWIVFRDYADARKFCVERATTWRNTAAQVLASREAALNAALALPLEAPE